MKGDLRYFSRSIMDWLYMARRLCQGRWRKHEVFPSCAHVVFDHYVICYSNWYKTTIMSHCLFQNWLRLPSNHFTSMLQFLLFWDANASVNSSCAPPFYARQDFSAGGEWRVAGDRWRVAGGGWRVTGDGWRVNTKSGNQNQKALAILHTQT